MSNTHWIAPHRVDTYLDMLPVWVNDCNFGLLVFTWLLPGPLDADGLEDALSRTLASYPLFAGRLIGAENWRVKLAAGNPVAGHISLARAALPVTYFDSQVLPTDDVMRDFHPDAVDPVLCDNDHPPSPNEPLVKIKVTNFVNTGETSITFAFCHLLGDGLTFFRFTNMVSQFYLKRSAAHPLPTYGTYFHAPPSMPRHAAEQVARVSAPHLLQHYPNNEAEELYARSFLSTTRLDMQFSYEELNFLKAEASKQAGRNVSKQDALAAYLVTAINRIREPQINQIVNLLNYRGSGETADGFQLPDPTSASSALLHVLSAPLAPADTRNLGKVARRVGETVRQVRDPEFVRRTAAATAMLVAEIFGASRQAWWGAGPTQIVLNNCYKLTSPATHFGYEGQVRFFVNGSMERYIRIWAGNPTRHSDGTWSTNEGSADVSFRIEHELEEPFMKLLAADKRSWSRVAVSRPGSVPTSDRHFQEEVSMQNYSRL